MSICLLVDFSPLSPFYLSAFFGLLRQPCRFPASSRFRRVFSVLSSAFLDRGFRVFGVFRFFRCVFGETKFFGRPSSFGLCCVGPNSRFLLSSGHYKILIMVGFQRTIDIRCNLFPNGTSSTQIINYIDAHFQEKTGHVAKVVSIQQCPGFIARVTFDDEKGALAMFHYQECGSVVLNGVECEVISPPPTTPSS